MRQHLWREVRRQLGEARGIGLVALLLLAVGGAWALLAVSALRWGQAGLARAARQTVVVAVLADGADFGALQETVRSRFPQARGRVLSPAEVAATLAAWGGAGARQELVPALLSVVVGAEESEALRAFLTAQPAVAAVTSSQEWTGAATEGLGLALRLAAVLASVLVLAFGALVVLAVRILVLSHADEIAIMRLIGAHEEDIRAPYLVAGAVLGLLGGLAAVGLGLAGRAVLAAWVSLPVLPPGYLLGTVAAGALAGLAGAAVGVRSLPQEP